MFTNLKTWIFRNLVIGLALAGLAATTTQAATYVELDPSKAVTLTNVDVEKASSYSTKNPAYNIEYCLNVTAKVTLGIYKPSGNTSDKVATLVDGLNRSAGCYTETWNANNSYDGKYFFYIKAEGVTGNSYGKDEAKDWIVIGDKDDDEDDEDEDDNDDDDDDAKNLKILDVEVDESTFDPWDDQEAEITFEINKDAKITLEIVDEDGDEVITLVENKPYEKGEYTIEWNGEDEEGEIVDQDEYEFILKAKAGNETDKETGTLRVKKGYDGDVDTEDPRLKNIYLTKDSFDPGRNEKVAVVFTLTAKSDVQVTIYDKKDKKVVELMDEDDLQAGTHVVVWDGEEAIDTKENYTFRVYAQNSKGKQVKELKVKAEEDDPDTKSANIYKDSVDQIPYSPKNKKLGVTFKLEKAADVTVEIKSGGTVIAKVAEEAPLTEGSHTIYWNGVDKYGDYAEDGVYKYKIVSESGKGKDTEEGTFSINGATPAKYGKELCGNFTDMTSDYKYCESIEWAVGAGIFKGYNDGSFKPNQAISRSEALKVIFQALNVNILSVNADNLGFPDVNTHGWEAPYIKTALSLGIVKGYNDGTFKPGKAVNRVEALIMLLNTAKVKDNIIVPTNNIGQPYYDTPNTPDNKWYISYAWFAKAYSLSGNETYFYPGSPMTRGEMADMLYKYKKI